MAKIEFLLTLAAEVVNSIDFIGYCCEVDGDEKEILGDLLEIESLRGDCCLFAKMDKVLDFAGCDNCFCCWLKGVGIVFLLEKGLLKSFNNCCKRLKADLIAVTTAVKIEIDFVDC